MKSFASVLMVLAAAVNAKPNPSNLQNAEYVKAVCKQREDFGRTTVRARAISWEATDTDAPITPRWVANKVATNSIKVIGKAKYIAGETFAAFISGDCRDAPTPSSQGLEQTSNFRVVFEDDGFATFRYETTEF